LSTEPDNRNSYEGHALEFLSHRDKSSIGTQVVKRWAKSFTPRNELIEIGCGGGYPITRTLVEYGLKVWAIDASPTLLAEFQKRFEYRKH